MPEKCTAKFCVHDKNFTPLLFPPQAGGISVMSLFVVSPRLRGEQGGKKIFCRVLSAKLYFAALLSSFLILLSSGLWCEAHKLKMFASAEGNLITGYLYYTTGGKPKNAVVQVQDNAGNPLGEITANAQGEFTYTAEARQDYIFVAELADGHRASFTVKAAELSDTLPTLESETSPKPQEQQTPEKVQQASAETEKTSPASPSNPQISSEEFEKIVDKAVAKQIRPLREQLNQYEEKVRLHDILGGVGYILGLMGLGYFLRARKKRH